jgi:starch-binding outer membrane protein, SusD/RagB family
LVSRLFIIKTMKNSLIRNILLVMALVFANTSCINDLDREPYFVETSASVYNDFSNYKAVLAKLYAGYILTGQSGPAGRGDIGGIDEGFSSYIRTYWQLQQLPTDEAIIAWNDPGLPDLNFMTWSADNIWVRAMYSRMFYQITFANEFIRETSDARLAERGIVGNQAEEARVFRSEARFLRALSYWHALDLFQNVPFVTEANAVGAFFPEPISRAELFNYVESELLELEDLLLPARTNQYARADRAAAWTVLTKLYLNAEVYGVPAKYTEAVTYANKVIGAGYALEPNYQKLFLTDNHTTNEIIFPLHADGVRSQTWGGTTFLVNAAIGGTMQASQFGVAGGWFGLRTTRNILELFPNQADTRGNFHLDGQQIEIDEVTNFNHGPALIKFKNVSSTGQRGSDPTGNHADTDYPMFRLADVYLMYAEAVLRGGGGGSTTQALDYINLLRQRAYGNNSGNITAGQLTLNFILDERARELKWEAHRRTDLIRFGRFTSGTYMWPWKGGSRNGREVPSHFRVYPIPTADLISNPNLTRTPGY